MKDEVDINAWKIYSLTKDHAAEFPEEYRWDKQKIEALMKELRELLGTSVPGPESIKVPIFVTSGRAGGGILQPPNVP